MTDFTSVDRRTQLLVLRAAWWSAVVLLVLHLVIWPGLLDHPATHFGSEDGNSATIRWIPLALIVWLFGGHRLVVAARAVEPATNGPIEFAKNAFSGSAVILLMLAILGVIIFAIALMARAAGALLT